MRHKSSFFLLMLSSIIIGMLFVVQHLYPPLIIEIEFSGVNAAVYFDKERSEVLVHVPFGTDRTRLKAEINYSGLSLKRDHGADDDFSKPVVFNVTGYGGRQRNYTVTVIEHHWELLTSNPGFKPRDGAGLLSFKGRLWLLGGWEAPNTTSQVWVSDDDGRNWNRLADAPWLARHGAGWIVYNDKMWVISGDEMADVWSSSDGVTWVQESKSAEFGPRYLPYVAVFKGKMWLMGGMSWLDSKGTSVYPGARAFNDVWSSTDGRVWTQEIAHAPWAPRGLIHGYGVLKDRLYIMGGGIKAGIGADRGTETVSEFRDVWYTEDGKSWTRATEIAPWAARTHFSVTSTSKYIYITDGSVRMQNQMSNEVWRTADGNKWERLYPTPWQRRHASSLTYHNGRLVFACGILFNDVWAMDTK